MEILLFKFWGSSVLFAWLHHFQPLSWEQPLKGVRQAMCSTFTYHWICNTTAVLTQDAPEPWLNDEQINDRGKGE